MAAAENQAGQGRRYLGLSFSGGGYRAAAFSLGTLALLKDLDLLGQAAVLSGVSGGSIALGAYLCAKAGAAAETNRSCSDEDASFYNNFFAPFLSYLSTEDMAQNFVHLSWLLQNRKLIKAAADANDQLFSKLLGQPALLGSDRIRSLLNNERCSPDYAFFNAADVSSLNLFRFGLQKHRGGDAEEVAFVVGRWILTPGPYRNPTRELYRFSKQLRVADCVAASHAFPVGLEPMVFPNDFFPAGDTGAKARAAFGESEVCERQRAVGLLDGGLYDNLGLASIEDIRELLNDEQQPTEPCAESARVQKPPFVVIATDVDNIQPSLSFYDATQTRQKSAARRFRPGSARCWAVIVVVMAVLAITIKPGMQWVALGVVALVLAVLGIDAWRQLNQGVVNALKKLGFTNRFVEQRSRSDMAALAGSLLRLIPQLQEQLATLQFNLWVQRAGQPVPMFSGYLKRTRALTYGYLQTKYREEREKRREHTADRKSCKATPHLVRNMIFELTQGAEADPDYASELITLPVQKFSDLNDEQEEVYRETAVMRKVRHAHVAAALILQQPKQGDRDTAPADTTAPGSHPCLMAIWDGGKENQQDQGDQDLEQLIDSLELSRAAQLWGELWDALRVGPGHHEPPSRQISSSPIHQLLTDTVALLEQALHAPEIDERHVLENCRISPEPVPEHYSWIPLICEMATNLPTTLWVEGYRYYAPNRIVEGRIETPGAWFSRRPGPDQLNGRPLLDLSAGAVCPAAAITTLAGYITTVFNLLEYYYSYLEHSQSLVKGLARALTAQKPEAPVSGAVLIDSSCQRALLDLPFTVRQGVCRQLMQHWQWLQRPEAERIDAMRARPQAFDWIDQPLLDNLGQLDNVQARLDLLRPWLHSRGPFPDSWWGGCSQM